MQAVRIDSMYDGKKSMAYQAKHTDALQILRKHSHCLMVQGSPLLLRGCWLAGGTYIAWRLSVGSIRRLAHMAGHNRKLKRELLNVWNGIQVSDRVPSSILKTVGDLTGFLMLQRAALWTPLPAYHVDTKDSSAAAAKVWWDALRVVWNL